MTALWKRVSLLSGDVCIVSAYLTPDHYWYSPSFWWFKVCLEIRILILPCSTCSITLKAFLAAHPPMDTWSSVAALVERESTEEGWHKALFSDTAKTQHNEWRTEQAGDSRSNGQRGGHVHHLVSNCSSFEDASVFYLDWVICNNHLENYHCLWKH